MSSPRLVCLLPARNAAADLPGFFVSAARFADAVVALDDGSTDESAELLAAQPLVKVLLRNPRRPDYRGWNDAANRNQLLAAAASLAPDWIISVDADERIDAADARALSEFLETDALPGIAYGFRCYPMFGDLVHYLPTAIWVYRLFAFAAGQSFPDRALHFAPIPTSIPRRAFVRTTVRIQHLGGLTREHRVARYEKYREADPDLAYWPDYTPLLTDPDARNVRVWQPRPAELPVLGPTDDEPAPVANAGQPRDDTLVVVLIGEGAVGVVLDAVRAVLAAAEGVPVEVALAAPSSSPVLAAVKKAAPEVALFPHDPGTVDARRAVSEAVTGAYILLLPPTMRLAPGSLTALRRAHQRGYAMAAATVQNGARRWQERADFLLAFGGGSRRVGAIEGAPRFCSYARALLDDPTLIGLDGAAVNRLLARRGYLAYREPGALVTYRDVDSTIPTVLTRAFHRGVAEGTYLVVAGAERGEVLNRRLIRERVLVGVPQRIARHAEHADDPRVRLLAGASVVAELLGVAASLARPAPGKLSVLLGRPTGTLLVATVDRKCGECRALSLLRYDLVAGELREAALPPALTIPAGNGQFRTLATELGLDRFGGSRLTRFEIDDVFARRFGLSVDDFLLLDRTLTETASEGLTQALHALGATRCLPRLATALRRGEAQTSLSATALLLLCRGMRRIGSEKPPSSSIDPNEGESFAEFAARVRAVVAPPHSPRHRTPRDALKLVEWA